MSDIKWTDRQEQAIEARDKNILVSAAAGSGKTTVLVERVIRKITDSENPVDIDSLIIMTFTKAAAAQMRKKIYKAVRKALEADPENEHLRQQLIKIHTARISTIDSLSLDIVRENFQLLDIDPGFSVADEAEIKMLEEDVLADLLEEKYAGAEHDFMDLADYYTEKNDTKLEDLVLSIYRFAQSHPEPDVWLERSISPYISTDDIYWFNNLDESIRNIILEAGSMAEAGLKISELPEGPFKYTDSFIYIKDLCERLSKLDFEDRDAVMKAELAVWPKAPTIKKTDGVDTKLKDLAKSIRDDIKDTLKGISETFYYASLADMLDDMTKCAPIACTIINLVKEFSSRLMAAKKEKKIADFSDVAHFALDVLIKHDESGVIMSENGNICFTEIADQMAAGINEIIVDEYQDTNMLQEFLVMALSSERFGRPNVFMVGDVKQSIYSFRMACPELFMSKFDSYAKDDPNGMRIILDSNFRSRKGVIDITNYIFRQIMTRDTSGIEYTDGNELDYKADYPEKEGMEPEIVFIDGSASDGRKAEGYEIAGIIEEIIKNGQVWEGDDKVYRPATYSDIALIARNTDNPQIEKILSERHIPIDKISGKGFFETFEIKLCLAILNIIDNPYQDIPFAAVLYSPIAGASADDLARIKIANKEDNLSLYEACQKQGVFSEFTEKIKEWQRRSSYMPISDFIDYVIGDSGLLSVVMAMPQGQARKANLDFLRSKASDFSRSSYSGLFNFIRYIKALKDSDIDFGKSTGSEESFDAVQVMTIHKSKGLEFPYVILAACGKDFNIRDLSDSIISERRLGLGIEYRNVNTKEKRKTLFMEAIKMKARSDAAAEEMRVLYVALTRAKEKLYLVGSSRYLFSSVEKKWSMNVFDSSEQMKPQRVLTSKNFIDMAGIALSKHKCAEQELEERGFSGNPANPLYDGNCSFAMKIESFEDVEVKRAEELIDNVVKKQELLKAIEDFDSLDGEAYQNLKDSLEYKYKYSNATTHPVKITASQLESHPELSEEPDKDIEDEENNEFKAYKSGALVGAERGNAYHRVFELIEYNSDEPVEKQIEKMRATGRISSEYANAVEPKVISEFLNSSIGKRMAKAALEGKLHREQPFVRGYTESIDGEDEMLLIQGIIDAFFEENGQLILVDYKTDRNKTEQELIETYKGQQDAYAKALEDAFAMPVKEMILYSTTLGKEIYL